MFEIYGGAKTLKQWSKNEKLIVNELPLGSEVHFYNDPNKEDPLLTKVYDMTDESGKTIRVCNIPNILLMEVNKIKAWVPEKIKGLYGKMHTISIAREKYITVEPAEKPADYVYEETELDYCCPGGGVTSWDELEGKPFGIVNELALSLTVVNGDAYAEGVSFCFIEDEAYTFVYEGVEYVPTCTVLDAETIAYGNLTLMGFDAADTGEPFCFVWFDGSISGPVTSPTSGAATLVIKGKVIKSLGADYIGRLTQKNMPLTRVISSDSETFEDDLEALRQTLNLSFAANYSVLPRVMLNVAEGDGNYQYAGEITGVSNGVSSGVNWYYVTTCQAASTRGIPVWVCYRFERGNPANVSKLTRITNTSLTLAGPNATNYFTIKVDASGTITATEVDFETL